MILPPWLRDSAPSTLRRRVARLPLETRRAGERAWRGVSTGLATMALIVFTAPWLVAHAADSAADSAIYGVVFLVHTWTFLGGMRAAWLAAQHDSRAESYHRCWTFPGVLKRTAIIAAVAAVVINAIASVLPLLEGRAPEVDGPYSALLLGLLSYTLLGSAINGGLRGLHGLLRDAEPEPERARRAAGAPGGARMGT